MIRSYSLSNTDIDSLLNLPEVIRSKEQIDAQKHSGAIYLNASLDDSLKEKISQQLGLPLSGLDTIPMRWIKGDTKPHIDKAERSFEKTYLTYLTSSPGELIVDGNSYPITQGCGYVFDENVSHETIGTGTEPRLLLGPMSEQGFAVGAETTITADGETETIYFRYTAETGVEYKINDSSYFGFSLPVTIVNSNTAFRLKVLFENNMTLETDIWYFICGSENIQFGSESLNSDGSRPVITIAADDYPGLISNGTQGSSGYNDIYIYNLVVNGSGYNIALDGGWIGTSGFGNGCSNNYIVNCSSLGDLIGGEGGSGGIVGSYAGKDAAGLYIIGCSSSGTIGGNCGGIAGPFAGSDAGNIVIENCWSTGAIGLGGGGIYGYSAGNTGGNAVARYCYSTGSIGENAGGIFGYDSGNAGTAEAIACYSRGTITEGGGGIFGSNAGDNSGSTPANNCYSVGAFSVTGTGIYGANAVDDSPTNCYSANGSWTNSAANAQLTGLPDPIVGTVWVNRGTDTPYELYNIGYTPYTIENIVLIEGDPTLRQTYSITNYQGGASQAAIIDDLSYSILQINDSLPSEYSTITINSVTGAISTTSGTALDVYTLYIRNEGSYIITTVELTVTEAPVTPICFPAGTLVLTDQGEVAIDKLNIKKHTISGKKIVAVTQTIPLDKYLICMEKNSISHNVPNRRTIISKNHKVMVDNKLMECEKLVQYVPSIYKIPYNKNILYNVLLDHYSVMSINNLMVETLHPNNMIAKIYTGNFSQLQKNRLIQSLNKYTKRRNEIINKKLMYKLE
jgi:hypothetical protein